MKNQTLLIALKWIGIQFGIGLILSILSTKLYTGGDQGMMGAGLVIGIFSMLLQIVAPVLAIRELEQKNGSNMSVQRVFGLVGLMFGALTILNAVSTFITYKFFLPASMEQMNLGPKMWAMTLGFGTLASLFFYIVILIIYGIWRVFTKAGQPGWASIVPIYNSVVQCEIGQRPTWWVAMLFIPLVNIVFAVMITNGISKAFGKDEGFTVGLVLLPFIFYPMLGFGPDRWIYGPAPELIDENPIEDHLVE